MHIFPAENVTTVLGSSGLRFYIQYSKYLNDTYNLSKYIYQNTKMIFLDPEKWEPSEKKPSKKLEDL